MAATAEKSRPLNETISTFIRILAVPQAEQKILASADGTGFGVDGSPFDLCPVIGTSAVYLLNILKPLFLCFAGFGRRGVS